MSREDMIVGLINKAGFVINAIQWNDEWKHWRVGLNWESEDNYEFICEKPTLRKGLQCCLDYINKEVK